MGLAVGCASTSEDTRTESSNLDAANGFIGATYESADATLSLLAAPSPVAAEAAQGYRACRHVLKASGTVAEGADCVWIPVSLDGKDYLEVWIRQNRDLDEVRDGGRELEIDGSGETYRRVDVEDVEKKLVEVHACTGSPGRALVRAGSTPMRTAELRRTRDAEPRFQTGAGITGSGIGTSCLGSRDGSIVVYVTKASDLDAVEAQVRPALEALTTEKAVEIDLVVIGELHPQ